MVKTEQQNPFYFHSVQPPIQEKKGNWRKMEVQECVEMSNHNVLNVLHETCLWNRDSVSKDVVILGSDSERHWIPRIIRLLPPHSIWRIADLERIIELQILEEIAHAKCKIVLLSPGFLEWLFRNPNLVIGRLFCPPSKVLGLLVDEVENLQSSHREQLLNFHQWSRVLNLSTHAKLTLDRLIKTSIDTILRPMDTAGGGFIVVSPKKLSAWKRNPLVVILKERELDRHSRVHLKCDNQECSIKTFVKLSERALEFDLPPTKYPITMELWIDGRSLGRVRILVEDPTSEMSNLMKYLMTSSDYSIPRPLEQAYSIPPPPRRI